MTDLNSVIVMGRITRDLYDKSFGYIGNGNARANISIAVNKTKKQGDNWVDEVSYFDVTIWGKTAENLKPYLTKGTQIVVQGSLKQDRWEKDGQKYSRVGIVADNVRLCGGKENTSTNTNKAVKNDSIAVTEQNNFDNVEEFPEDIPF